jgi:ABC-2 type transport system ATP-binding protein
MIKIQDLTKYYGARRAVGPLSFSIEAGEIVGLLGLNGAGKTTTLRVLACDLLPSSGSVRVDGLDVVDNPDDVRRLIGYLPDTPPLYLEMTVNAYLHFAARVRGLSRSEATKRVREVEEATEIDHVSTQVIASLSHGYKQRVGIAQAIVHRPRLLVLDEPISGLDPVQIVEMRELLRSLRGDHTILISSHILSEISETCDRLLVIRDGEIAGSGTEAELSAQLVRNRVATELTVRSDGARAEAIANTVAGVLAVTALPPSEPGEGIATILVNGERDLREALGKAFIEAGVGLLGMKGGERQLESVFKELTERAPGSGEEVAPGKRKHRAKSLEGLSAAGPAPRPITAPDAALEETPKEAA